MELEPFEPNNCGLGEFINVFGCFVFMGISTELHQLMTRHTFAPNKKLAQNFVVNEGLLKKMVEAAELSQKDVVLEVGAGTGFLTRGLLGNAKKVVAVELDHVLCNVLKETFAKEIANRRLELIEGNFLEAKLPKFNKVVSLPPYTISSQLLYKIIGCEFESAILVFQHEFALKCLSKPGFSEFCPLAVLIDYYFDSKILIERLLPENFFPSPKAISSLIKISRKKSVKRIPKEKFFSLFLKNLFRYKNKNLANALEKAHQFIRQDLKIDEKKFKQITAGLAQKNVKVYLIEPFEFVEIFRKIY